MAKQTSLKSFFQRPNATDEGEPSDEDEPVIPEAIDVRTAPPEKRPKCRAFSRNGVPLANVQGN